MVVDLSRERGVLQRLESVISTQDQSDLHVRAEEKLASAAEESALVRQAEEHTRAMLIGMLGSLELEVEFTDEAGTE